MSDNKNKLMEIAPKTLRVGAACRRYSVGSTKMRQLAKAAGAEIHAGGVYLIDVETMDKYLETLRKLS